MRRAERLFEIIEILRRARAPISAEAIGKTLGVTKRTVYRDMAALMVLIGNLEIDVVEIGYDARRPANTQ